MSRKQLQRLALVLGFALATAGAAYADDSSMSMWTGDSYAFFNDLDYHPGGFNTARMAQPNERLAAIDVARKAADRVRRSTPLRRPSRGVVPSPFHDDTGN